MHLPALLQFLEGLSEHNNRPWFVLHKPAYDILREEFLALVTGLVDDVRKFDRDLGPIDPKKSALRIYRNLRFSRDKTPFKTNFACAIGDRAQRGFRPAYYFHIDAKGILLAGGGIYQPDKTVLANIRRHIAEHPEQLTKVFRNARFKKTYGGLAEEESLVNPPKGYTADTPHIDAIRMKHFFGIVELDVKKRPPKDLRAEIAGLFRDVHPLVAFLREASQIERPR
ncbi:MAG: DUF2461 domain-containing protein [Betaproteobacteria bacterium]|nr:DUF2461 domain-containing protein [Betaproteobacteria bacterium]